MIISIHKIPDDRRFDICIVGSGPAGITLALSLAKKGKSVLLLEGGAMEYSEDWQDLYAGENVGDPYHQLDVTRLRQFGGTSNHWSGWCRPLDAVDYEEKNYAPGTTWPISKSDLDPYLPRAMQILDISGNFNDAIVDDSVKQIEFKFSKPTRFSKKYRDQLSNGDNILLAVKSSVTGVDVSDERIESVEVRDLQGTVKNVCADTFVIACGGIESNRLLMHLNNLTKNRLIPNDRTLGRYWSDHPHFTIGECVTSDEITNDEYYSLTPRAMQKFGVLNCGVRVQPLRNQREGWRALAHDLACTAPRLGTWVYGKMNRNLSCYGKVRAAWEQAPSAESRITLSIVNRDTLGVPRAVLDWKKSTYDIKTVRVTAMELGRVMAQTNRGRIKLHDWVLNDGPWPEDDEIGGHHHMGGTRMSQSSREGIVNSDLRLWAMKNTYILGSSVFPSGGHGNPTLTIVQLALRLAEQVSKS